MPEAFVIPKRAMAIFAHPDDVDFGCSGTLGSWIATAGTHVTYCVITSGQKGTHDPKASPEEMAETREREQRAAGAAIGVKEFVFLGRQDGELERSMALRGEICRVIREHKPDVVFTNDPWSHYQVHPDHRVAGWSALDGVIAARDHLFFPEQLRDSATPEAELLGKQIAATVNRAMEQLPDDLRTAITLREIEGLSYEEIANVMNCPIGTVRSRIFRAREAIAAELRPLLGTDENRRW